MYDFPVFKVLANNDTGAAPGHQGGIVIPADLGQYFPDVIGKISLVTPTADVPVDVSLIVGGRLVSRATSRYQYQTWGGQRSPERRLTSNLGPLRNEAVGGDLVLFERDLDDMSQMRLTLIKQTDPEFPQIRSLIGTRRWGTLRNLQKPLANDEISVAEDAIEKIEAEEFKLFDSNRTITATVTTRKARAVAFRKRLMAIYEQRCAVTGQAICTPDDQINVDAAHIVPVDAGGIDDPRNGLLLSKDIHWAFDRGLLYVGTDRKIGIPVSVKRVPGNNYLAAFAGQELRPPALQRLAPASQALEWHRKNISAKWS